MNQFVKLGIWLLADASASRAFFYARHYDGLAQAHFGETVSVLAVVASCVRLSPNATPSDSLLKSKQEDNYVKPN